MAGSLVGAVLTSVIGGALCWWVFVDPILRSGQALFPGSAMDAATDWARLAPLPDDARGVEVRTVGGPFTREFRVSFYGEPAAVAAWVESCPGIQDSETTTEAAADGTLIHSVPAGSGAVFAEIRHHPIRGTVEIRTYWS